MQEAEQIRQYYFDVVDSQFSDNGHFLNLTGKVDFVGIEAKCLGRMDQLRLRVLENNFNTYFLMGEQIEGSDLREAWWEMRQGVVGLFSEVLSPEDTEKFLQTTEGYFVALYDLDGQPQDLLGIGFNGHTRANLMGLDKPDVYINLHHLTETKRDLKYAIMEMRQNGEVITEEEENHLKRHFVHRDVRVSIAHELLHWLKGVVTGSTGNVSEEEESIIEMLARVVVTDPDDEKVKRPDKAQLATFLGKK